MVVLSRFPILTEQVRTFQNVLWASMPDARLPDDPATAERGDWYSAEELGVVRLSSKSHGTCRSTSTTGCSTARRPPDPAGVRRSRGPQRHPQRRRGSFLGRLVAGGDPSWIVDDAVAGGLAADSEFVIVGDLNSGPVDGDSIRGATQQLLDLDRVQDPLPTSDGAVEAAELQGGANAGQQVDSATDTADFTDEAPGNLRADYVLPSDGFDIVDAAVFGHRPPTNFPASSSSIRSPPRTTAPLRSDCADGAAAVRHNLPSTA
jgi:hypothetical protein